MSETHIAHDGTAHVCYRTTTGRDRDYIGCRHDTPRLAIDHLPASRSAVDPHRSDDGGQPRQSEALDMRPDAARSTPDGRGDRYSPRPVDAHPSTSMSGNLGL